MNGSAPNSPATGSQMLVAQNCKPNFAIDSWDWRQSSTPIADHDHEDQQHGERAGQEPESEISAEPERAMRSRPSTRP